MSRNVRRAVDVASACLVLLAVALRVWPVRADVSPAVRLPALALGDSVDAGVRSQRSGDSIPASIVRGNIFSSSRRAPATRFTPPGAAGYAMTSDTPPFDPYATGVVAVAATTAATPMAGTGDEGSADPVPALFGIVSIDGVRKALLMLRAGDAPRLFAAGDRHAGYRISAIDSDRAVLVSSRGTRTLRLTRPASRDSSENNP